MADNTFQVTIKNAPINSTYAVYLEGTDSNIAGGKATEPTITINLNKKYKGDVRIMIHVRQRTRTYSNITFPIEFVATGENVTFDINDYLTTYTPGSKPKKATTGKKLITNKLQEKVQEKKAEPQKIEKTVKTTEVQKEVKSDKKLLENELKKKIQTKKQSSAAENSFWDRLK